MDANYNVLPSQKCWMDRRLLDVYHNEFAYKATPPATKEEWQARRDFTRAQVSLAAGLFPMPEKTPLEPKIWGHTAHEGTVIAKVSFESMPGLKCTGNLYMPERVGSPAPGILCPHGHWQTGRVHNDDRGSVPMRCLMLARLGFIVFSYDMIGYNDNNDILHRLPNDLLRESALWGTGLYGLQTWNSLRALDFLCDLPEVDERRIGCTGASGGASQTWTVSVLDERIKVIAPVCMLSSHYQGGCQCEEGPLLRLNGVTSFDILAACAPRPLLLPAVTQDWTVLNPRYEIPALQQVYELFNASDALCSFQLNAPHNYNQETREHIYPWFTHWLLNQSLRKTIAEDEVQCPTPELLRHTDKPATPTLESSRRALETIRTHVCAPALPPVESLPNPVDFRNERVELVSEIINNDQELKDICLRVTCPQWPNNHYTVAGCLISRREAGDIIPAVQLIHEDEDKTQPACLLLSGAGKQEFLVGGKNALLADDLLSHHCHCLVPDLLGTGETADMPAKSFRDENDPTFLAFNPSLFSMRVQDILTCLKLLEEEGYEKIAIVATDTAVKPALCALALCKPLHAAVLDMESLDDSTEAWSAPLDFQPMIFKAGGAKGLAALATVRTLALYKPNDELGRYAKAMSDAIHIPHRVLLSSENFQRFTEYAICGK